MQKSRLVLRHLLRGALFGVICLLAPLQAEAACAGSDRTGKWQFYFKGTDGQESFWIACKIVVNSSGGVRSGTNCLGGIPAGTISFPTTGGSLSVGSNCAVRGNIKIGGCPFKFQGATMSRDGQKMAGVGSECGGSGTELFDFLAVKR